VSDRNKDFDVKMDELLMGRVKWEDVEKETQDNLISLQEGLEKIRDKCKKDTGKGFKINDGLRRRGIDKPKNGAEKSTHYLGLAADVDDDDTLWLWKWCLENLEFIWECGFCLEDPRWTHGKVGTWMHFQKIRPGSGKFIYVPSTVPASLPEMWDGKYDKKYDKAP
jgi:hypothetical protein